MEDALVDAGYRLLQAEGGAQALVLLDGHPSLRVGRRGGRRRPDLRVILISGFIDQVRPRWPFLRKPFLSSKLCDLVAHEMRRP